MNKLLKSQGNLILESKYTDLSKTINELEEKAKAMQTGFITQKRILALLKQARTSNTQSYTLQTRVIIKRALELYENYQNNY